MNAHPPFTSTFASRSYAQSLEQMSDQEFWQLALEAACPVTSLEVDEYLECILKQNRCLLPLTALREVVPPPYSFSRFPASPSWMIGVSAWRGEVIAVIDLEAYLWQRPSLFDAAGAGGILVVAQLDHLASGFLVPSVATTLQLKSAQVIPFPSISTQYPSLRANVVTGVKREQEDSQDDILILDIAAIFASVIESIKSDGIL
jgi:chemotaxis signal transduction protein